MKKTLLFSFAVAVSFNIMAQNRISIPANIKNISLKRDVRFQKEYTPSQVQAPYNVVTKLMTTEVEVGQTMYDLQSNASVDHRIFLYSDGTIGTTWTMGSPSSNYVNRGTGYNYFDGTSWITPNPTVRIEPIKTGWPTYSHLGVNNEGEVVIAHEANTLYMSKRATKGTGAWSFSLLPYPATTSPSWPRICAVGDTIHLLAADYNSANYQGQLTALFYYRSQDAGATWNIQAQIPAGLTAADGYTQGFGGDVYSWAEPVGNTIAFVVGDSWNDLILMKSTDGGDTWTKTIIFQHPFPDFTETTDFVGDGVINLDTPYVCDGHHAVSLDAVGNAHVAFGIMRVSNADITDAQTSYFPAVDGIYVWNETEPTITGVNGLNPDTLYANNKLIAWVQDRNGDGVVFDNWSTSNTFAYYGAGGLSSQPQISVDTNGDMYLVYTSTVEDMITSVGEYYNYLWGRKFNKSTGMWCDIVELTAGTALDYDGVEMAYPSLSKTMDNNLHIVYQYDFEPGVSLTPNETAVETNSMMYITVNKNDLSSCPVNIHEVNLSGNVNIYPNPVANNMTVTFAKSTDVVMNIYNSLGALVMTNSFTANKGDAKDINMSKLATGIYMVKLQTAEGTYTNKIIKE